MARTRPWEGTDAFWAHIQPLKKVLSRLDVPLLAQHRVHQIAIVVDGSIERAPFPMDFDRGFTDVPGFPGLLLSFAA